MAAVEVTLISATERQWSTMTTAFRACTTNLPTFDASEMMPATIIGGLAKRSDCDSNALPRLLAQTLQDPGFHLFKDVDRFRPWKDASEVGSRYIEANDRGRITGLALGEFGGERRRVVCVKMFNRSQLFPNAAAFTDEDAVFNCLSGNKKKES